MGKITDPTKAAARCSRPLDCSHAREDGATGAQRPLTFTSADSGTGVRDRQAGDELQAVPAARYRQGPGQVGPGDAGLQLQAATQLGKWYGRLLILTLDVG